MKKVNLIGAFVFINQGYGILSSMYHNTGFTEPHPETAKKKRSRNKRKYADDPFDGFYTTIWLDDEVNITDLEITRLDDGSYKLKWYTHEKVHYEGIGFLRNGELIGSYWN